MVQSKQINILLLHTIYTLTRLNRIFKIFNPKIKFSSKLYNSKKYKFLGKKNNYITEYIILISSTNNNNGF